MRIQKPYFFIPLLLFLCQISVAQIPANGLVGYYPFNGNGNDVSSNENHGIVRGATLTDDRCGYPDSAYAFDGYNDHIELPASDIILSEYSYSVWIKVSSFPPEYIDGWMVFSPGSESSGLCQGIGLHPDGGICATSWNIGQNPAGSWAKTSSVVQVNQWVHIVTTRDLEKVQIYINGQLMPYAETGIYWPYTNGQNANYGYPDTKVIIGCRSNMTNHNYFKGSIDDLAIYNRVLTDEEIQQLYLTNCRSQLDPDLTAIYPFNGNAHDESGNYNHGTVHNAVLTTDRCNVENSAYYFNGYSSYIELPPAVALNTDNSFSIVAWICNDAITSDGKYNDNAIYGQTDGYYGSDFPIIVFEVKEDNTVKSAIRGTGYPSLETRSNSPVNNDEWYQVVLVRNALTDSLSLYINGEFKHGNTADLTGNTSSNDFVSIGAYYDDLEGMYHYFCGKIDDVMLLNKSLTSEEVRELYQTSECTIDTVEITVDITGEIAVCQNQKDVVYSVPFMNGVSYSWNYSGSGAFIQGNSNSIEVDFSGDATGGELTVGVSRPNHEIIYSTVNIVVKNLPGYAQNIAGPLSVCRNEVYYYSTPVIMNAEHYEWSYSGEHAEILGQTDSIRVYFYDIATSGSLMVTGVNQCGSGEASEHFPIIVRECDDISSFLNIPNSFSPNGDNINDLFIIQGLPENTKVEIFNRNGKLIYKSDNYSNDWNGYDINGNKLNTDTYWYIISVPGISTEFKGFIYLKK